jgi:hypothetical protein
LLDPADRPQLDSLAGGHITIGGDSGNFNPAARVAQFPHARMIVLFTGPLAQAVRLPLSDASSVLYIQESGTFRKHPAETRVLDRVAEFSPPESPAAPYLRFWVEGIRGRSGGSAVLRNRWWQVGGAPPA